MYFIWIGFVFGLHVLKTHGKVRIYAPKLDWSSMTMKIIILEKSLTSYFFFTLKPSTSMNVKIQFRHFMEMILSRHLVYFILFLHYFIFFIFFKIIKTFS